MIIALIVVIILAVWVIDGALARSRRVMLDSPGRQQAREYEELRERVERDRERARRRAGVRD